MGLYTGGLIHGWAYIRNGESVSKLAGLYTWGLYSGGLYSEVYGTISTRKEQWIGHVLQHDSDLMKVMKAGRMV